MTRRLSGIVIALTALGAGCVTLPRTGEMSILTRAGHPVGFAQSVRMGGFDGAAFQSGVGDTVSRLRQVAGDRPISILALSGGGAGGAFGAGAIVGLTRSGARPDFDVVTGVSTGALIAPFAYLGPAWDPQLEEAYTGGLSEKLTAAAGLESLFRVGVFQGTALRNLVEHFITDDLIRSVAHEAVKGRLLLVATTNLDSEETVIWDLGAIAMQGGKAARDLFVDILVASSSVPGAFPAVMIDVENEGGVYQEMHVDGGATVPFFVAPHVAFLSGENLEGLDGANVYVIINGQLSTSPRLTPDNTLAISMRGFSVVMTQMARTELVLTGAFASARNMTLLYSSLPQDYPFAGSFDFNTDGMRGMFDYGARCAREGRLWVDSRAAFTEVATLAENAAGNDAQTCPIRPNTPRK